MEDLKKRTELQAKLQEVLRRSGSSAEINRVQAEIEKLNRKLESYASRTRVPTK